MRNHTNRFARRATFVAVQAAIWTLAAAAPALAAEGEAAVRALVQPTNTVELGAGYVTNDSAKFGEYNGLFRKGGFGIFNFDLKGGGAYDSDSALRYRLFGDNIFLDNRSVRGEVGRQGTFRVELGYDELRRERSDTYQTPYDGAGSNTLTLPSSWVVPRVPQVSATGGNFRALSPVTGLANALVSGVSTPPTAAQQTIVNNTIATDAPLFRNYDIETTRKAGDAGLTWNIDPRIEFNVSVKHEDRTGTKPLAMISLASGTAVVVLPDLIDQSTDQYNASVTYKGDQWFLQGAYYGSVFKNNVSSMNWNNPFSPTTNLQMSSAPSNDFHQFQLTGGYNFSKTTKLVMNASYARTTQDDGFLADPGNSPLGLPASSLNGKVETTAFNAKLTSKPLAGMNLVASYKFEDRKNKTPVNTYEFYDAGEAKTGASPFNAALGLAAGTLGSNINIYANRPYGRKLNQANVDADYAIAKGQTVRAGYEWQQIDRSCDGSWYNCAWAKQSRENTLRLEWRAKALDTLSARVAYAYSERKVDYDENAWLALVPMGGVVPTGGATTSALGILQQTGLGAFGPLAPYVPAQGGNLGIFFPNNSAMPQSLYGSRNDIHELPGMRRFSMADRNRNKARAAIDWQASERLAVAGGVDYVDDDYKHSAFGLTKGSNWAFNLDGTFTFNDNVSANLFYTYEDLRSKSGGWSYSAGSISNTATVGGVAGNTVVSGGCYATVTDRNQNAKIDPCLLWNSDRQDKVDTFGAGLNYRGLMAGKLDLTGTFVYAKARSDIGLSGGTYANNPAAVSGQPAVNPAVIYIPAQNMPTITTTSYELRLNGQYALNANSSLGMLYWYQRLKNTDFMYEGMQFGSISSVMPTNEQAPNYNVHVFGLSYQYRWQ